MGFLNGSICTKHAADWEISSYFLWLNAFHRRRSWAPDRMSELLLTDWIAMRAETTSLGERFSNDHFLKASICSSMSRFVFLTISFSGNTVPCLESFCPVQIHAREWIT